jgi:hypothetical protein
LLPPISETQLVTISLIVLLCGLGIGFILGSLWMEQRLKKRAAAGNAGEGFSDEAQGRDKNGSSSKVRISA